MKSIPFELPTEVLSKGSFVRWETKRVLAARETKYGRFEHFVNHPLTWTGPTMVMVHVAGRTRLLKIEASRLEIITKQEYEYGIA